MLEKKQRPNIFPCGSFSHLVKFSCKKEFSLSSEQFSYSKEMVFSSLFVTFSRIPAYLLFEKMASYISLVLRHEAQLNIFTEVKFLSRFH